MGDVAVALLVLPAPEPLAKELELLLLLTPEPEGVKFEPGIGMLKLPPPPGRETPFAPGPEAPKEGLAWDGGTTVITKLPARDKYNML